MTTSDIARDRENFTIAKKALRRLIELKEATRLELFDNPKGWWPRIVLERTVAASVVRREKRDTGKYFGINVYYPTLVLASAVEDDSRLAAILWPGAHNYRSFEAEAEDDGGRLSHEEEPRLESSDLRAEQITFLFTPNELNVIDRGAAMFGLDRGSFIRSTVISYAAREANVGDPDTPEMLSGILKIVATTLQNVVDMREKLVALESEIGAIRKVWQ